MSKHNIMILDTIVERKRKEVAALKQKGIHPPDTEIDPPRGFMRALLDAPGVINLITRFAVSSNARELGALTVAMLEGEEGPEPRETEELAEFLGGQLKPDVICFSNILLSGAMPRTEPSLPDPPMMPAMCVPCPRRSTRPELP